MTDTPISVASQKIGEGGDLQVAPTPFYLPMLAVCRSNEWETWNGYTVPRTISTVEEEYDALHYGVGIADISPRPRYRVKGQNVNDCVNRLTISDLTEQQIGQSKSSAVCNIHGGVIDVVEVLKMAADEVWMMFERPHLPWLMDSAIGFDVVVDDMVPSTAGLQIVGPKSFEVLSAVMDSEVSNVAEYQSQTAKIGDVPVRIVRRGQRSQPMFEIWLRAQDAQAVWSKLLQNRSTADLQPIGRKVTELNRVEEGRLLCGVDFLSASRILDPNALRTTFDLGMGHYVEFDQGHFNGRQALERRKPRFAIVGLDFAGHLVEVGEELRRPGERSKVGTVLSCVWSPRLKSQIGLAEVEPALAKIGAHLETDGRAVKGIAREIQKVKGRVTELPFLTKINAT